MSFVPADFADDTDLERLTVARLGAARHEADSTSYDLRGLKRSDPLRIERTLTASVGFEARQELRQSLQPVAFGAAYKIVDMLVEHVLRSGGASGRLTFAHKTRVLRARPANLPVPFASHPDFWDASPSFTRRSRTRGTRSRIAEQEPLRAVNFVYMTTAAARPT